MTGEQKLTNTEALISTAHDDTLGVDVLYGQTWKLPDGVVWSFSCSNGEWLNVDPEETVMAKLY